MRSSERACGALSFETSAVARLTRPQTEIRALTQWAGELRIVENHREAAIGRNGRQDVFRLDRSTVFGQNRDFQRRRKIESLAAIPNCGGLSPRGPCFD